MQQYWCVSKALYWQKKPETEEYTQYDSTYIKFKNQQCESIVIEVSKMEERGDYCLERDTREFSKNKLYLVLGGGSLGLYIWKCHGAIHLRFV